MTLLRHAERRDRIPFRVHRHVDHVLLVDQFGLFTLFLLALLLGLLVAQVGQLVADVHAVAEIRVGEPPMDLAVMARAG